MRGLDPRIHDEIPRCIALRLCSRRSLIDCRVKPGNDHAWVGILCRWYNSLESRFDLAYNAAHAFSLAALRLRGYRPNKIRYIVFQALPLTLNLDEAVRRVLDKAHNLRNSAEYEGHFEVGEQLLNDLIKSADAVFKALQDAIKEQE